MLSDAEFWNQRLSPTVPGVLDASKDVGYRSVEADIAEFERQGHPADDRGDIDTESLKKAYPMLAQVTVEQVTVDSPHGPLPARVYAPPPGQGTGGGFVWMHGGGFIGGDLEIPEAHWVSMELAARGVWVVSLEYHKALNGHRADVLSDDALAGWREAARLLTERGITRIHLGGGSAGAALAGGLALRLRDSGESLPASVVLVYPLAHPRLPPVDFDTAAAVAELDPGLVFTPGAIRAYVDNLLGPAPRDIQYVLAGAAADLTGLPPFLIITAERDVLRGSGELFGQQLREAGVRVEIERQPDIVHGHLNQPGDAGAIVTIDRIASWVAG